MTLQDQTEETVSFTKYDRRSLTYANSFHSPFTASIIRGDGMVHRQNDRSSA